MAHHKAQLKSIRQIAKRSELNRGRISRVRTFVKRVEQAIEAGDQAEARTALTKAQSELARAVTKGLFKKETVSRKVSRLNKKIKAVAIGGGSTTKAVTAKKAAVKKPAAKKAPAKKAEAKPAAKKADAKKDDAKK
jgi:small subunit ribosomal protein S20